MWSLEVLVYLNDKAQREWEEKQKQQEKEKKPKAA